MPTNNANNILPTVKTTIINSKHNDTNIFNNVQSENDHIYQTSNSWEVEWNICNGKDCSIDFEVENAATKMSFGFVKVEKDAYVMWFIAINVYLIIKML